jgi:hypothetical protein
MISSTMLQRMFDGTTRKANVVQHAVIQHFQLRGGFMVPHKIRKALPQRAGGTCAIMQGFQSFGCHGIYLFFKVKMAVPEFRNRHSQAAARWGH